MKLVESVTIQAPVERVFAIWSDIERYSEWADPVILREKRTDGPTRVGTIFKCVDRWPGREVTFEMEITEFEENKRLGARWSEPMRGQWTSELSPAGDGTQLDFTMEVHLP
ncbi:MAG: SRPBCC family protein, partial [Saprospiraceae bacterium]|nr:SRPBCC family protein [Saprospiraceae bacterium]